jgi:DNA repair protein RecO (recombination protein O)
LDKLLPLPGFLRDAASLGDAAAWAAGLRLTGHFLERDAFGARHRPVPEARFRLAERIAGLVADP